jgi:hypothetical protein
MEQQLLDAQKSVLNARETITMRKKQLLDAQKIILDDCNILTEMETKKQQSEALDRVWVDQEHKWAAEYHLWIAENHLWDAEITADNLRDALREMRNVVRNIEY